MPFNPDRLMAYPIPEGRQSLRPRDCILYALGIGLGADPLDPRQLRYLYEADLLALPMMANVLANPGFWLRDPEAGIDWRRLLHGEQVMTLHRPLPVEAELIGRTRIVEIEDKGPDKGAFLDVERQVRIAGSDELLCTLQQTLVCRGDGGCGARGRLRRRLLPPPEREADLLCDLPILPQAALIYRLSGDMNPLHADPEVARHAGFERPILHGLCTFGVAGHALLRSCCDYAPGRLRGLAARFSAPVYPGETLRTEIWRDDGALSFRSRVLERDRIVLTHGRAELAD
jgi:acyl dehydratase